MINLNSDTATRPTPAMRQAIASAEVGDDMMGEDPTVNHLESMAAEMLGKEAAVFACSGTQSNQMGLRVHCLPGDELLINSLLCYINKNQDTWLCQTQAAARQPTQLSWYGRGGKAGQTDRPTKPCVGRPPGSGKHLEFKMYLSKSMEVLASKLV